MDILFEASHLSCLRQGRRLFSDISFSLHAGQALLVEGVNGSGKSSLLRLLSGLSNPIDGEVRWNHLSIHDARTEFAEELHFLGHTNGIKCGLTIDENLSLAAHLHQRWINPSQLNDTLALLQLTLQRHTHARYLSAGQKRRIALAKLFLLPKKVWILDEPLTALDTHTQTLFLERLDTHLEQGGIAVVSSHHAFHLRHDLQTLRLSAC